MGIGLSSLLPRSSNLSSWRKIPAQRSPKWRKSIMSWQTVSASCFSKLPHILQQHDSLTWPRNAGLCLAVLASHLVGSQRSLTSAPTSKKTSPAWWAAAQSSSLSPGQKTEIILIPRMKSFTSCLTSWAPAFKKSSYKRDSWLEILSKFPRTIVIHQSEEKKHPRENHLWRKKNVGW